jgi:hypothetical protein
VNIKNEWCIMDGAWMNFAWGHMEHVCMAPKHSSWTLHVLMGRMFKVSVARASKLVWGYPPKLDMFRWMVGFEFQVMFQGTMFPRVEIDVELLSQHDMFWHQFTWGSALPVHWNLHQITLKWATHLWLVEIMSRLW